MYICDGINAGKGLRKNFSKADEKLEVASPDFFVFFK